MTKLSHIKSSYEKNILSIISALNKLPNDEIISSIELSKILKRTDRFLRTYQSINELKDYTQKLQLQCVMRYWGNKKAILQLRKERADLCL